jgi:hypothetical protein
MQLSDRVEDVTGESPSWWALELYKAAFLLAGGAYIGWAAGAAETAEQPPGVFGETVAAAPPEWLAWLLVPGIVYLILAAFPWPGLGSGGLSM